ncbi:family 16 glycoside hydrolase [Lignipirellula cremea]|uniref:Cytochrome c n=1 Tax=Lignipirellula cremea TaxID=2528010 RepID=A0A518E1W6_9BACT|nr:family 16 glycoside hydrolase [Lignipirellula cremea]QDU98071.1 Cytochrome c [Lignipirellula cremea]
MRTTAILLLLALAAPAAAEDGFVRLFNGRDLAGWKGNPELWSVEDGAITGKTNGPDHLSYNQFLVWDGEAADFELRLEFRLEGANNSGVQYRSALMKEVGEHSLGGYQADIHGKPEYTGMLYDERGRGILAQRGHKVIVTPDGKTKVAPLSKEKVEPIDVTQWHTLTVIARGNRLVHKIDDETTIELVDEQESARDLNGLIGLQVHRGPAMKAQFKNIRLKKFDAADKQSKAPVKPKGKPAVRPEHAQPVWVWLPDGADKVYLRKEFPLTGISSIHIYAATSQAVKVWVNGEQVLTHVDPKKPAFINLTSQNDKIREEPKMAVAVEAEKGKKGPGGVLLRIDLDSGWRESRTEVTDRTWRASTTPADGWQQVGFDDSGWARPQEIAQLGDAPWKKIDAVALAAVAPLREPTATAADSLKLPAGFHAELLYSVPKAEQGSWVNMCVDPKGRLIVSDQYGSLYRVTPPPIGVQQEPKIEKIDVPIGDAQGLLWAFDSLYVVVNTGGNYDSGVYRVRDTDGDDVLDQVETLRKLTGGAAEHGPHAVLLAPDGKGLYIVCGNKTDLTKVDASRVPQVWDEDLLLPRPYGRGFMIGTRAPGGYIARMDPDGKNWELAAVGFRNEFDAAFNADGELFAYDADMEWDWNTPWYRPTRVCHVVSGAEFGWRNGGGKWPVTYADSVPPMINIGPGSPTGVTFGYGAKFPAAYQNALFICDWTYGKMYAVRPQPLGASYLAAAEDFVTGVPLPLTDVVINPHDGAMYFAIGGRRVQSGLYRVTYQGTESTAPVDAHQPEEAEARALRRQLEALHVGDHPDAVKIAWPHLGSSDRFLRFAARTAIEHRPLAEWRSLAVEEAEPQILLAALMAMARMYERQDKGTGNDIDTPPPVWDELQVEAKGDRALARASILAALDRLDWDKLSPQQQLEHLRVLTLTFLRIGPPTPAQRAHLIEQFDARFPATSSDLNFALSELLVYLQAPQTAAKAVALMQQAPTQEEQIYYAKTLRHLRQGWTPSLQKTYFQWFVKAASYRGGNSFTLFVDNIKKDAVAHLSPAELAELQPILDAKPANDEPFSSEPRPFVHKYTMQELAPLVEAGLQDRNFEHGRQMFAAAKCFACHRFDNRGGAVGPDLTALSGRFSPRDILESVLEPNKAISDQYQAVNIITLDGRVVTGRIVNFAGDSIRLSPNMLDPNNQISLDRKQIDEILPSKVSLMPEGLLDTLEREELLDLMAYLLSRGDPQNPMFQKK